MPDLTDFDQPSSSSMPSPPPPGITELDDGSVRRAPVAFYAKAKQYA